MSQMTEYCGKRRVWHSHQFGAGEYWNLKRGISQAYQLEVESSCSLGREHIT